MLRRKEAGAFRDLRRPLPERNQEPGLAGDGLRRLVNTRAALPRRTKVPASGTTQRVAGGESVRLAGGGDALSLSSPDREIKARISR